jgi:hypothetical protein
MSDSKPANYHFFVDNKKYDTSQSTLTAMEIKTVAAVPSNYQLFLEERGKDPDRGLSDTEAIPLDNPPKHFFAVPPATFGRA